MDLKKFREEIKQELIADKFGKGETPIMDRLQIHLDNIEGNQLVSKHLLHPDKFNNDLVMSMLYQIVYPAKVRKAFCFKYENIVIEEKDNTKCLITLINNIGVDKIKTTQHSRFIFSQIPSHFPKNVLPSSYKKLSNGEYFDRSFGGKGINNYIKYFIDSLNEELGLDIEFTFKDKVEYK